MPGLNLYKLESEKGAKMFQEKLRQYARLLIQVGVNVQPGQTVVIRSPVECAPLVRLCAEQAYQCGCREVVVDWRDDDLDRQRYLMADDHVFDEYSKRDQMIYEIGLGENAVMLDFYVSDPDMMAGVDPQRVSRAKRAKMKQVGELYQKIFDLTAVQCTASPPIAAWAKKVFPALPQEQALEALWEQLFLTLRINGYDDAAKQWSCRLDEMQQQAKALNDLGLRQLRYRNALGTDLKIEMPEDYRWMTCLTETKKGQRYVMNLPTEEIYAAPRRTGVDGIVYGSLPLVYQGNTIRDFWIRFEHGKVVEADAKEGKEVLMSLIGFDEGAAYLGEVALVPCDSAISRTGTLFYNPLYDENASCHLALGLGIVECIPGSEDMSREELSARGINYSGIHVDFMIGTQDLSITGTTQSGAEVAVFENGAFSPAFVQFTAR